MIAAAKADGQIDQGEMERIIGKLEPARSRRRTASSSWTRSARRSTRPRSRARCAPRPRRPRSTPPRCSPSTSTATPSALTCAELATALKLDPAAVAYLHETTGAPAV
jgi:hypothetical protein